MTKPRRCSGFTLIEVLIVVVLMAQAALPLVGGHRVGVEHACLSPLVRKSGQADMPVIASCAPDALGKVKVTPGKEYVEKNPGGAVITLHGARHVWINGLVIEGPKGRPEAPKAETYGANIRCTNPRGHARDPGRSEVHRRQGGRLSTSRGQPVCGKGREAEGLGRCQNKERRRILAKQQKVAHAEGSSGRACGSFALDGGIR
jgi:prepilin-type N-terminal cleavage/methylation domain-containing protein